VKRADLIVFLGPSLPHAEAVREARAAAPGLLLQLSPPARQGDIWRALRLRPRAIALVDGVFESAPSVWHHELLDALDGGVLLFGASSMGALRAAELRGQGMIGVGAIYQRYRDGETDDAAVALLHASAEHGFRPLTVPLVNAEHAVGCAVTAGALGPADGKRLLAAARALHYQERTWHLVLERAAARGLGRDARARWERFAEGGLPDLKADDARLCLREAARAAKALRTSGTAPPLRSRPRPPSALVRQRRLDALAEALPRPDDGSDQSATGLRTLLLAGLARSAGLRPTRGELDLAEAQWLRGLGHSSREQALDALSLAADEAGRLVETLALERLALDHSARLLPDGPSQREGARLAALISRRRHRRG
jgi:hypothetical protein